MKISVTIVSYKTREVTLRCLSHLHASEMGPHTLEVIVLDNASGDGTPEAIQALYPSVHLIRNHSNLGFAAGQNLAIQRATGEAILVLNSDVFVKKDAVRQLATQLTEASSTVGVLGPRVEDPKGQLATSGRRLRRTLPAIAFAEANRILHLPGWLHISQALRLAPGAHRLHDNFRPDDGELRSVGYVDGMASLFRREALEVTGLFDEQFFFDCEILDLGIRLANLGFEQQYVPMATVVHVGGASRDEHGSVSVLTNESKLRFYAKHYPQSYTALRRWALLLLRLKLRDTSLSGSERSNLEDMLNFACTFENPWQAIRDTTVPRIAPK